MKQTGDDLCNLPEVNGFKHIIVLYWLGIFQSVQKQMLMQLLQAFYMKSFADMDASKYA